VTQRQVSKSAIWSYGVVPDRWQRLRAG